jgi:glycine dehydrogenase subunit 1
MRYLPLSDADRSEMLRVVGARSIDDLFRDVPRSSAEGPIEAFRRTPQNSRSSGT